MKNMWIILLLCVAVVALSVRLMIVSNKESKADAKTASEDVIECIMTRASVRKYTSEPVADSLITTVLKAGMAAPTAVNQQAWHFVVIKDQTLKDKISDSFQWAKMVKGCAFAPGSPCPRLRRSLVWNISGGRTDAKALRNTQSAGESSPAQCHLLRLSRRAGSPQR